jgi:ubiquinone/menaquinone biosynthesis C-methylase UbiE
MSIWGRLSAAGYDQMMKAPERATLHLHREALISQARGDVLEIGGGTGANLRFYGPGVETLTLTEPEPPMVRRLERHVRERRPGARVLRAPAEDLPFADASFDFAVSTLVLCTVDDQPRAVRELRRVLRPGGRLLFLEHVRSDEPRLARWQDRLNWLHMRLGQGCNCNRSTLATIGSEFSVTEVRTDTLKKAYPIVRPLIAGVAEANGAPRQA